MKRLLLKSFSLIIGTFSFLNSFSQTPPFISDSLDSYIEIGMKQWQIPGLAIAIVKDGKVVLQKGSGIREIGKEEKVDENTLFIIASNSKLFTGTSMPNWKLKKNFPSTIK